MPAQQQIIEAASPIMLTRDVPPRRSTWSSGPRTRCTSQPRHALLKRSTGHWLGHRKGTR